MAIAMMRGAWWRIMPAQASRRSVVAAQAAVSLEIGSVAAVCRQLTPVTKPRIKLRMSGRIDWATALTQETHHKRLRSPVEGGVIRRPPLDNGPVLSRILVEMRSHNINTAS